MPVHSSAQDANLASTPDSQSKRPVQKTESVSRYINRARELFSKGYSKEALVECNKALKKDPTNQVAIELKAAIDAFEASNKPPRQ
jgi:Tfp pilus assembly protein PilF